MPVRAVVTLLLLALTVSGCGFQLRGSMRLPDNLQPLLISSATPNGDLEQQLRQEMQLRGVALTTIAAESQLRLELGKLERETHALSLDADARASEYDLSAGVDVTLHAADGSILKGPQHLAVHTSIINDPDKPLNTAQLNRELVARLASRITDQVALWSQSLGRGP